MSNVVEFLTRPHGSTESSARVGPFGLVRRLRLRRADGDIYLDRWGIGHDRIGRVLIHRMQAPDPGIDLHDHPWWFASIILKGGYTELRADIRDAVVFAGLADLHPSSDRGVPVDRRPGSIRTMRLDECHTITRLRNERSSWSLVIGGPRRRRWGFYMASGFVSDRRYVEEVRSERRDLFVERGQQQVRP